ncbi:MAG: hypothetical protein IKG70_02555 [Lachnospiraceae bacterium]|nr:hypothetical protein [Lachnospiraceae bacterium]
MKRFFRRFLTFMVAAFMITAILPAAAHAEENYPAQIKEIPSGEDFS